MSFILFVLSWFVPYAIYRKEDGRAEAIRNVRLKLGQIEKNPAARKRSTEAKRLSAIYSAIVMGVIELPFLFLLDEFTRDGLIGALGVATGAALVMVVVMPKFEDSAYRKLDYEATTVQIEEGLGFDTGEGMDTSKRFLEPEPSLPSGDGHGSAKIVSAARSGLINDDAMAPVKKGGR